jgi:hypothetical protein
MIQIKSRSGAVVFASEMANLLRDAVTEAVKSGAYLRGADLGGADLGDADLRGAYLRDAYLGGAYLGGADLGDADLGGARNVPAGIDVTSLSREEWERRREQRTGETRLAMAERIRTRHPDVPVVADLDARMLEAVSAPGHSLNMSDWHSCDTTHCRAGWAIHLAGKPGYELEAKLGPHQAGRLIYLVSTGRAPWFFDSTEGARKDIERCAAEAAT